MAEEPKKDPRPRYVSLTWEEMDTPLYRQCARQIGLCMALRRFANWDTGVANGSFSFFGRACGISKSASERQMKKLAARGVVKFLRCRRGRRTERPDWTEIQVFDFLGNLLISRNREIKAPEMGIYRPANGKNTNREERPVNNKEGLEKDSLRDTGQDLDATKDYLHSMGVRGRTLEELTGMASLKKCTIAWDITKRAREKGKIKRKPDQDAGEALTSYFIGTVRNLCQFKIPPSPPQTNTPSNEGGAGAAGRATPGMDQGVDSAGKRPANRPDGASDSDNLSRFDKKELQRLRDVAASARLKGASPSLKEITR